MKKQFCIFDLDGTLVNTLQDLTDAVNAGLFKCDMPTLSLAQTSAIIGYSTRYLFEHAVPQDRFEEWPKVSVEFAKYYAAHCCDNSAPYEGILPVIAQLKNAGMRLAVVTNKPHGNAIKVISNLFPKDSFNMVLGRMDRFATKPAPDALQFALDYFDVAASDAVYIGDSEVDIQFAKNAHVECLSCSWGYRTQAQLVEAGAVRIMDDPLEIPGLVL